MRNLLSEYKSHIIRPEGPSLDNQLIPLESDYVDMYRSSDDIVSDSSLIIETTRSRSFYAINVNLIERNWLLGRRIVEEIMIGGNKENYGNEVIKNLSKSLKAKYGAGFSVRNLYNFSQFYRMFPDILHAVSSRSPILTWTHYRALLRVIDDKARNWYAEESLRNTWSARTLERNISTQYYYRMLKTSNPEVVESEMKSLTKDYQADKLEFIKNPVVVEFLGISPEDKLLETDLETAILNNIQKFLLEMGRGYSFVARQRHIRTECDDYFIDLVLFNYELSCFVLIDLKVGKLTHQDVGQMDMYVRMYDELIKKDFHNPTLGIILCSETDQDVVHYSVLNDKDQLFTAKYLLHLPSEEQLREEIEAQKAIYYSEHPEEDDGK